MLFMNHLDITTQGPQPDALTLTPFLYFLVTLITFSLYVGAQRPRWLHSQAFEVMSRGNVIRILSVAEWHQEGQLVECVWRSNPDGISQKTRKILSFDGLSLSTHHLDTAARTTTTTRTSITISIHFLFNTKKKMCYRFLIHLLYSEFLRFLCRF